MEDAPDPPPHKPGTLERVIHALPFGVGPRLGPMFAGDGLKARALRGSTWTGGAFGATQLLRLGSNLVLTRLLFPEAFGLMALVNVLMQGLQLFSDVGIRASIIHHARGSDPEFLNTAWTVQIVRGGILCLAASLIAYPMALYYDKPDLAYLMPLAGLGALATGFGSVNIYRANRDLQLGLTASLELASRVVAVSVTVGLALAFPSVWTLVVGGICASVAHTLASHVFIPGPKARIRWDRESVGAIFRFGRWILLATALAFLAKAGDRLILGKFMTEANLGLYAIGMLFPMMIRDLIQRLSHQVLFPVYSTLHRGASERLRNNVFRSRSAITAISWPALMILCAFGREIVSLLYDHRYEQAGWVLEVLAFGNLAYCLRAGSGGTVMLAKGSSFQYMLIKLAQSLLLLACMAVGGWLGGSSGIVVGVAVSMWLGYLPECWSAIKMGVWFPGFDFAIAASSFGMAWLLGVFDLP